MFSFEWFRRSQRLFYVFKSLNPCSLPYYSCKLTGLDSDSRTVAQERWSALGGPRGHGHVEIRRRREKKTARSVFYANGSTTPRYCALVIWRFNHKLEQPMIRRSEATFCDGITYHAGPNGTKLKLMNVFNSRCFSWVKTTHFARQFGSEEDEPILDEKNREISMGHGSPSSSRRCLLWLGKGLAALVNKAQNK